MKNCLSCTHYFNCKDPHKSIMFLCKSFASNKESIKRLDTLLDDVKTIADEQEVEIYVPTAVERARSFSIQNRVTTAIESARILPQDLKVDDSHFPEAANFIEWCMRADMLNMRPFVAQALILVRTLAEYCPKCSDLEWMDNAPVDATIETMQKKVSMLRHGVCPHCKARRHELIKEKLLKFYNEGAVSAGQRSGKSAMTVMLHSYIIHRVLKMGRPAQVYNVMKGQMLQGTFVALTYAQAKDTLWDSLYSLLLEAPWFSAYHEWLAEEGARTGTEYFKLNDTFVTYRHRLLEYYPAGPDKRVLRGRTRIGASLDELGWFPNDAHAAKLVKMNANEVYTALSNSLVTVRSSAENLMAKGIDNVLHGMFFNISSPANARDKIMELVKLAQRNDKIYGICKPTWEINPLVPFEALAGEFKTDPVKAWRDFGAKPPMSTNPFITNLEPVENCMILKPQKAKLRYKIHGLRNGDKERYAEVADLKGNGRPSVLSLDAGLTNNSFAMTLIQRGKDGGLTIPLMLECQPLPGVPLNHGLLYRHVIRAVMEAFNVTILAADRWQSSKLLADAELDFGCTKVIYSLKYRDMASFRQYLYDEELAVIKPEMTIKEIEDYDVNNYPNFFKDDPAAHFYLQCMTVQDAQPQVFKGENLTDDLFRAAALGVTIFNDDKYYDLLNQEPDEVKEGPPQNVQNMVFMKGMSKARGMVSQNTGSLPSNQVRAFVSRRK